jgi:cytochrome c-type biogenesis protein CcmH
MEVLVQKLAAKLKEQPENRQGWIMLGRSYMAMGQPEQAIGAYQRALELNGEDASLLLAYAESLAKMNNNDFTGKPASLIEKAHQLEADNPNALWMMGILSYQRANYQQAIDYWKGLADMLGPQSKELAAVDEAINDARNQLGLGPELPSIVSNNTPQPTVSETKASASETVDHSAIQVRISLAPELRDKTKPSDTVFIYAKASSGPPMPLAAARKQVEDLPLTLTLDDSMAMMPQLKLSAFESVLVGARVSLSGDPSAQAGDLEGEEGPVKPGRAAAVTVTIDRVHE